jgi:hypothetical protein
MISGAHTDRPLTYEQTAEDTSSLLRQLKIAELRRSVDVRERIYPVRRLLGRRRDRCRRKLQSTKRRFRAGRAIRLRSHTRHRDGESPPVQIVAT